MTWLLLLGCLVLAGTPLLIKLHTLPPVTLEESQALARSEQHWHAWHTAPPATTWSQTFDRLMPPASAGAASPGLHAPPGRRWLHMLSFVTTGAGEEASSSALRYRARLVSVVAALGVVGGIYWAGYSLGGAVTALLAGLMTASMPLLVYQGRLATGTMPIVAGSVLAVAAALWAMRPFRPSPSPWRQGGGWALAGLALAAVLMLGGAVAVLPVVISLAVMAGLCRRRLGHSLGLVAAITLAALAALPWVLHLYGQADAAWASWLGPSLWGGPAAPLSGVLGPFERLGWLAVMVLPWTLWVGVGLWPPLKDASPRTRGGLLLGWSWFIASAVVLAVFPAGGLRRALMPLLPLAALLGAQVLRHCVNLSLEGRHARVWQIGRWVQFGAVAGASVLLPVGLWLQPVLVRSGWLDQSWTAPVSWLFAMGMAVVLLALAGVSLKLVLEHFPGKAAVCWAVWMALATSLTLIPASDGRVFRYPLAQREPARPGASAPVKPTADRATLGARWPMSFASSMPMPTEPARPFACRKKPRASSSMMPR